MQRFWKWGSAVVLCVVVGAAWSAAQQNQGGRWGRCPVGQKPCCGDTCEVVFRRVIECWHQQDPDKKICENSTPAVCENHGCTERIIATMACNITCHPRANPCPATQCATEVDQGILEMKIEFPPDPATDCDVDMGQNGQWTSFIIGLSAGGNCGPCKPRYFCFTCIGTCVQGGVGIIKPEPKIAHDCC